MLAIKHSRPVSHSHIIALRSSQRTQKTQTHTNIKQLKTCQLHNQKSTEPKTRSPSSIITYSTSLPTRKSLNHVTSINNENNTRSRNWQLTFLTPTTANSALENQKCKAHILNFKIIFDLRSRLEPEICDGNNKTPVYENLQQTLIPLWSAQA